MNDDDDDRELQWISSSIEI